MRSIVTKRDGFSVRVTRQAVATPKDFFYQLPVTTVLLIFFTVLLIQSTVVDSDFGGHRLRGLKAVAFLLTCFAFWFTTLSRYAEHVTSVRVRRAVSRSDYIREGIGNKKGSSAAYDQAVYKHIV